MKRLTTIPFRILKVLHVIKKYEIDKILATLPFSKLFKFFSLVPYPVGKKNHLLPRGEKIKATLEELGPIYVKFGQALSTRQDLLPQDIAQSLIHLQDNVTPFPGEKAKAILEKAYDAAIEDIFADFQIKPLASASIAQAHLATLKSGEEVVVKILRPKIEKTIIRDIALMRFFAKLFQYKKNAHRLKPLAVVKEFEETILDELDLVREGANASQLKRNFTHSPLLYVPKIYFDYCKKNVLVSERIHGIPINDVKKLKAHKINIPLLAKRGVEIFFTQVFYHQFFHADMHAGNIFVSYQNPHSPKYICVDFGIMGALTNEDKKYLALNLLAFLDRDYQKVASLHIDSGWIDKNTNRLAFESAIRTVCEPVFEKPLKDISFAEVFLRLINVSKRFNMEVQPQLLLIQKTLFAVEGLGRTLYPELNIFTTAKPILEKWLKDEISIKRVGKNFKDNLPFIFEFVESLPSQLKTCQKTPLPPATIKPALSFYHALFVLPLTALALIPYLNTNMMIGGALFCSAAGAVGLLKKT